MTTAYARLKALELKTDALEKENEMLADALLEAVKLIEKIAQRL